MRWPMSVLRLTGPDRERLALLADRILSAWRGYSDESVFVFAETEGQPHNTITPIARRRGENYQLDLVLRNNITTEEHPLGVFHPHAKLHHIKKENIGLIEVMGLAVLPSRLKQELNDLREAILAGRDLRADEELSKHADWVDELRRRYTFTSENTEAILRDEVGRVFEEVLEDAGVFKRDAQGQAAFLRFVESVEITVRTKALLFIKCSAAARSSGGGSFITFFDFHLPLARTAGVVHLHGVLPRGRERRAALHRADRLGHGVERELHAHVVRVEVCRAVRADAHGAGGLHRVDVGAEEQELPAVLLLLVLDHALDAVGVGSGGWRSPCRRS